MPRHAVKERLALADTLRRAGPDAPTLSGEWTTAQLAAHLVLRERSLLEMSGRVPVRALRRRADEAIERLAAGTAYAQLVSAVAAGPSWRDVSGLVPVGLVWSAPLVREQVNLLEYSVHHEDVRRAADSWQPRRMPVDRQVAVWKRLATATRLTLRTAPVGVILNWPSHGTIGPQRARRGGPAVTVTGDPLELALFVFGRRGVAQVDQDGAPDDLAALREADISI